MQYQHKIIKNYPHNPQSTIWKFETDVPYIPSKDDKIVFPENWKDGQWFKVTSVEHYIVDKLIVIRVNEV